MVHKIHSNNTAATRLPPNSRFLGFSTKDYLYVSHLPTSVLGCGPNPQVLILATDSGKRKPQLFLTNIEKTAGNLRFRKTLVVGKRKYTFPLKTFVTF